MTVIASFADRTAYAKLGGAMDNLSEVYPYVAKGLSSIDAARDPLTNSGRMEKFLKVAGKAQKAYSYYGKIKDVFDEKKRDGALLKLGIKVSIDLAGKLLGTSLTTHPYYVYHKAHIEALADALNSHRNAKEAIEAYKRAVRAAKSEQVEAEFKRIESRKVELGGAMIHFRDRVTMARDIALGNMSDDFARKKIAQYGKAQLDSAVADLDAWRAGWSGLAFDAMQLQIMAGNEMNVAVEAMNQVNDLINTLVQGTNTGKVMGYGARNAIEWEKYDKIVNGNSSDLLMRDPVKYAQGVLDKAGSWSDEFSAMCDFVRSDEVYFANSYNRQLEKLNKVLYG